MTLLILKLSSLVGKLSASGLTAEQREEILRDIQQAISEYFRSAQKKN